jgi:hypothetical protein|tara:strand:+ start:274 stop:903 length:630 start_codon:yes stop_codon:yes gene_type:complete
MRVIFFFLLILLVGCSKKEKRFIPSQEMKSTYSQEELADIQILVELFNSKVCQNPNDLSCYRGVLRKSNGDIQKIFNRFSKSDSDMVSDFISQHPNVIWSLCPTTLFPVNRKYQSPCLAPESKFALLLNKISTDKEVLQRLETNLQESGALQLNFWLSDDIIINEFTNRDLNNPNINFILAIGILGDFHEYQLQLNLGFDPFDTTGLKF